ncbi:MAG: hypothetical protein LQ340_001728 [Diploschistes diacapsis]|nr:MAG: hypothetical protein LQ340_001728 [Diploschistes diacapsis]
MGFVQRWDLYNSPTYVVSVKPALESDVQEVTSYSYANNISFLATGGGHGYSATLGALNGGVESDLGVFNTSDVDLVANTLTVGGSVPFSNVFSALQAAGKELHFGFMELAYFFLPPATGCSCVGIVGATLGGGIGYYSGLHGVISDSLLSARIITGKGELLTASATSNSHLFWAIKGAGFNYGVVTEATFQLYDQTNGGEAMNADMMFPASANGSVWKAIAGFVGNQPKELSLNAAVVFRPGTGLVMIVNAIFIGPSLTGQSLIKPFLDLQPINLNISTLAYKDVSDNAIYGLVARGCARGVNYTSRGLNLYSIDPAALVANVNYMNASIGTDPTRLQECEFTYSQFAPYGLQLHAAAVSSFGSAVRTRLQASAGAPNGSLQVYVHFAQGNEDPENWYTAAKLPRLRELKARYDPGGLFRFYNPVA